MTRSQLPGDPVHCAGTETTLDPRPNLSADGGRHRAGDRPFHWQPVVYAPRTDLINGSSALRTTIKRSPLNADLLLNLADSRADVRPSHSDIDLAANVVNFVSAPDSVDVKLDAERGITVHWFWRARPTINARVHDGAVTVSGLLFADAGSAAHHIRDQIRGSIPPAERRLLEGVSEVRGSVSDTIAAVLLAKGRRIEAGKLRTETHPSTKTKGTTDDF